MGFVHDEGGDWPQRYAPPGYVSPRGVYNLHIGTCLKCGSGLFAEIKGGRLIYKCANGNCSSRAGERVAPPEEAAA